MRVGFSGLGRMGRRMAKNLATSGFDLTIWNRSPGPVEELVSQYKIDEAETPKVLAQKCDIILTMLADDEAASAVYLGKDGLIETSGATTLVEMGTMSPTLVRELSDAASQHDKRFIDAPVSGAIEAAQNAQLLIMAGGEKDDFPQLPAIFSALGRETIWLGKIGSGAVMKLAVNMLIHGLNQTLSEALALTTGAGIDPTIAFDVIENSAASAPMLKYRRPLYLDEASQEVSFTVNLAAKDVDLALDLAKQTGVSLPQSETTLEVLRQAITENYGERDMASIVSFMKEKIK